MCEVEIKALYELPRGSIVYLICAKGARSLDLVPFMRAVGYDAYSVAGDMRARLANDGHDPAQAVTGHPAWEIR